MQYSIYSTSQDAWRAMYRAIQEAKSSIYWELYIFIDDEDGKDFFDLLEKKARDGVDVKLIIDGWGSIFLSRGRIDSLKTAGVDVRMFHERKYRYRGVWQKIISRSHRKILVVDNNIGFVGGVNIKREMRDWLDLHVRLEGDAVRSLVRAFAKMYMICGGPKENVRELLKNKFKSNHNKLDFIYDDAGSTKSKMRKRYSEALSRAKKRVIFFSPYYYPDRKFIRSLWLARRRGIRVDLLIPFRSDIRLFTYATYAWFSLMGKFGVNVYLVDTMMHGKGVIVDDEYAIIGSSNLEHTSFYDNYEVGVRFRNRKFVRDLKLVINGWLKRSKRLDYKEWEKRGLWSKMNEWLSVIIYRLWHRKKK